MLLLLAIAAYACHFLLTSFLEVGGKWGGTNYTLHGLYVFGFAASLVVTVLILLVNWSMPEKLGMVFLGLMAVKIIASYIFIQKGLGQTQNKFLEINFLAVFFLFLFFDVYVAFKALNEEVKKA